MTGAIGKTQISGDSIATPGISARRTRHAELLILCARIGFNP